MIINKFQSIFKCIKIVAFGDTTVGRQDGIIDNSLHLILAVPQYLPEEKRFDIMMLALILLINLVEQSEDNKQLLITSRTISNTEGKNNLILFNF